MHTYVKSKCENLWTVGHYRQIGHEESSSESKWIPMRDFTGETEAASYVNYLNGGNGNFFNPL